MSGGLHEYIHTMEEKYCNMSLSTHGMMYFLILMCPQDSDILRMNSKAYGSSYRMPYPYFIQSELLESIRNARNKTINAQCF